MHKVLLLALGLLVSFGSLAFAQQSNFIGGGFHGDSKAHSACSDYTLNNTTSATPHAPQRAFSLRNPLIVQLHNRSRTRKQGGDPVAGNPFLLA